MRTPCCLVLLKHYGKNPYRYEFMMHADCKIVDCPMYGIAGMVSDGFRHVQTVHPLHSGDSTRCWHCVRLLWWMHDFAQIVLSPRDKRPAF